MGVVFIERTKVRLRRNASSALTYHSDSLQRGFSKHCRWQSSFLAGDIGLSLTFVETSSWESKGDRARGGSKRALAKPFMVRGVAKSSAHPLGKMVSCSMATVYGPGHPHSLPVFPVLLSFQAPFLVAPATQQRNHSWPKSAEAPAAGSSLETMG